MNPILEINNLTTTFFSEGKSFVAVDNLSLVLEKGKTVAIVGESGSGKSVTSMSIMRLLDEKTTSINGEINYYIEKNKINLLRLKEKEIRSFRGKEIAMIFQEPMTSLNPVLTCGEQVAEMIRLHEKKTRKEAKHKTITLFEKVKLPRAVEIYDSYPHQLSGGQKQRVMIAMAISCNPKILIADEPTTALDVTVQKSILELLKELQKEFGMSMIFITHDLGIVSEIADEVVVMYKGKVVEKDTTNAIFSSPSHPYTLGLISCKPPVNKRFELLPTISDFMKVNEDGSFSKLEFSNYKIQSVEERKRKQDLIYTSPKILEVKNIVKTYHSPIGLLGIKKSEVHAVNDVSFSIYEGETLGLVGESGCGKSTLGKIILKLLDHTSGKLVFKNTDISNFSNSEMKQFRKKMQIVFQDPYSSLNPKMKIGEAIAEPIRVHKIEPNHKNAKDRAIQLLEQVGLSGDYYNRYPNEFSGGQRQRIVIARALAVEPEFIICDESVSALDASVQAQILNLLHELKSTHKLSYLFISHDLNVVRYVSDRIAVMNKGIIEQLDDADEVYANPKTDYVRKLIEAIPQITLH